MSERLLEVEIRVPPATARLLLALALLCLLSADTISENMTLNNHYAVPSGAFDGLTATGVDAAGAAKDTILNPLGNPAATVAIRSGAGAVNPCPGGAAPCAKLMVGTTMTMGSNNAPLATVFTRAGGGRLSGVSVQSRVSGLRWAIYPNGTNLWFDFNGANTAIVASNGQLSNMCWPINYPLGNTTSCPASWYVYGQVSNAFCPSATEFPATTSGVPQQGCMLCCRILEELP